MAARAAAEVRETGRTPKGVRMKKTGTILIGSWLLAVAIVAGATTTVQPRARP